MRHPLSFVTKIAKSTTGTTVITPVAKDSKTGKLTATGKPTSKPDKPTNKQLPANAEISPGLHDEVIKATEDNQNAIKNNVGEVEKKEG
jgi:uncharacterized phage protein gp47/JayE